MDDFLFRGSLADVDPDVAALVDLEAIRQTRRLIMIPSESSVPVSVREAVGSVFHNIYAEGYPTDESRSFTQAEILDLDIRLAEYRRYSDARYYKGTEFADAIESLARRRAAELFATAEIPAERLWVNVQPLSGAPANNAVYSALIEPGDTIMGLNLLHGGHLTHGSPVNFSGKLYRIVPYGVRQDTETIDYDALHELAKQHRPKLIQCGATAYSRQIDFARFRAIADEVGALLFADIAHIAGLVATGHHPSPVGHAQLIGTTTHKTLRGPRGGMILCDREFAKPVDSAVFPGGQGGPLMHVIAAKAVAFLEAQQPAFRDYCGQIIRNAQTLAATLAERGFRIVSGGTDNHLFLLSLVGRELSGKAAEHALEQAGVTTNKNMVPFDPRKPAVTSGVRIGTPAATTRGLREDEMRQIGAWIARVLEHANDAAVLAAVREEVRALCARHPLYVSRAQS
jgi:glycine hydroxymethyltransferase